MVPETVPVPGHQRTIFDSVATESVAMLRKRDRAEMAETALAVCSPTRSDPDGDTMFMEVGLDDTQVLEPGGKRWKQDDVAKEMHAANKATMEMMSLMMRDAEKREQRLAYDGTFGRCG